MSGRSQNVVVAVGIVSPGHCVQLLGLFSLPVSGPPFLNSVVGQRRTMSRNIKVSYLSRIWLKLLWQQTQQLKSRRYLMSSGGSRNCWWEGGMMGPNSRPPDGRRREAPQVVCRLWDGFGRGPPLTLSRKGVRGCYVPIKFLNCISQKMHFHAL